MTKEEFEEVKPALYEAVHKAVTKAAEECPEGLYAFLGMSVKPEDPCDEEFMQTISGM